MKRDATKKRLLKEAHEMAHDLHQSGFITMANMHEFDAICLTDTHNFSANKIKKLRKYVGISQAVLAKIINVSVAAIKQWERGERKPSGPALKLLNLIEAKGLDTVL